MKKIGIMTLYYNYANYGAQLQSFALQKTIEKMGYESKLISYFTFSGTNGNNNWRAILKYRLKSLIKKGMPGFHFYNGLFRKAIKEFEILTPHTKVLMYKNLNSLNKYFDAFVCGSDQIWNPIGWQSAFFLSFSEKPKISYAASIARDTLSEEEVAYIEKNTREFIALSVREKNNAEELTTKLDRKFELMPDPTLLLSKAEWDDLLPDSRTCDKPYIFAYFLGFNEIQRNECIRFANKLGMDIFFVPFIKQQSFAWDKKNKERCVKDYSVNYFINMIKNADLVLTDSYHGLVFSCIYQKPFYVLNRQLVGKELSMNSRMETLFYELEIPANRMISTISEIIDVNFSDCEIECIQKALVRWREVGLEYLRENLDRV